MTKTKPSARVGLALLGTLAALLVAAPGASADTLQLQSIRESHGLATFSLSAIDPMSIHAASVRWASRTRRVDLERARAGARRGVLRVRIASRARGAVAARARRPRRMPRLSLALSPPAAVPAPSSLDSGGNAPEGDVSGGSSDGGGSGDERGPRSDPPASGGGDGQSGGWPEPISADGRLGTFETGDFSQFDNNSSAAGTLKVTDRLAYTGHRAAEASTNGDDGFQRVWYDVNWGKGTDTWYGAAYYVPSRAQLPCWAMLARWDNYKTYARQGDTGGVELQDGEVRVVRGGYDGSNYAELTPGVRVPEGRWFWLEVHQRLSDQDGAALTELYMDGSRVGSSTKANSRGRQIDNIRYGYSAVDQACTGPSTLFFDDVSMSDQPRGPR